MDQSLHTHIYRVRHSRFQFAQSRLLLTQGVHTRMLLSGMICMLLIASTGCRSVGQSNSLFSQYGNRSTTASRVAPPPRQFDSSTANSSNENSIAANSNATSNANATSHSGYSGQNTSPVQVQRNFSQSNLVQNSCAQDYSRSYQASNPANGLVPVNADQTPVSQGYQVRYQSPDPRTGMLPPSNDIVPAESLYRGIDLNLQTTPADRTNLIADVVITGNQLLATHHIMRNISSRPGRYFDPDQLQQDVDRLYRLPEIRRINGPYIDRSDNGIVVSMEIIERNRVRKVEFIGNRGISDRTLKKETDLEDGGPLDVHQIRMTRTRIENLYKEKGYPRTQVEILEGDQPDDLDVVYLIHEDQKQRYWKTGFEGNRFASDARLLSFVESKPSIVRVIGGLVQRDEIENDITRLTNYYRKFGFFNARIGREISESNDGRWVNVRFIIDEGPRYKVRNVSFVGNSAYTPGQLSGLLKLKPGKAEGARPDFNAGKMNEDVVALRDLYGSEGFVYSSVNAEPRFLEEPGLLDLVYKIEEGERYRVGKINVHIAGDYGITQRRVVLNRLLLQPGDFIDSRKISQSETRLGGASIFAGSEPGGSGAAPRIVVRPREDSGFNRMAEGQRSGIHR